MNTVQEILIEEMRDLYDAEKQLVKALPKFARAASDDELRQAFTRHLEITRNQVERLEQVFGLLGEKPRSRPCLGMKGLLAEGQEHLSEHKGDEEIALDESMIASAQKVEHYEIAGYGTCRTLAKAAGMSEAAQLLDRTLHEEGEADKLLSKISIRMLKEQARAPRQVEEDLPHAKRGSARAGNGRSPGINSRSRSASARTRGGATGSRSTRSAARSSEGGGRVQARSIGAGRKSEAIMTTNHDEIRRWAEERGAHPACVRGTGGKGDIGMLRFDFPGYTGAESLEEISWDEFFEKFDENQLGLLYQPKLAGGGRSNFNKLVSRETVQTAKSAGSEISRSQRSR